MGHLRTGIPLETDSSGNVLYAIEIDFGSFPNNGSKEVAHNLSNFSAHTELFKFETRWSRPSPVEVYMYQYSSSSTTVVIPRVTDTVCRITTTNNYTAYSGVFRLFYRK